MVLKKIGLTGSNGLVGNHLIPMLLKSNFIITPTAKIKTKNFKKLNMLNKINEKKLDTIFGNVDCLIHMASILPGRKNINKNHFGTLYTYHLVHTNHLGGPNRGSCSAEPHTTRFVHF